MRRIVVDLRLPNWVKYGVVVFAASDADRDEQIQRHYPGAVVSVTSDRPATEQDLRRHAEYEAWLTRWMEHARQARAGWHMAHPRTGR